MWQQLLQQAMANGNSTANTMVANSMNKDDGQKMEIGGKFSGKGLPMGPVQSGSSDQGDKPETEQTVSELGQGLGTSDERTKQQTPDTGDMIREVAERVNNYTYHYKPGMGEDPSVEYSGPMAQELLQVDGYRSCVFEGEDGLLKVDTGRLALVNAGMVADLSKRLLFLEEFVKSVMGSLQEPIPDVQ
jgi:hypothetical protein